MTTRAMVREQPDPFLLSTRLRRGVRQTASRVFHSLKPRRESNPGITANHGPIIGYREHLDREPAGRALLTYLVEPFRHPAEYSATRDYSNWMMSRELAAALNRLGYIVDVINYDDYEFQPAHHYDVFMGMAVNFSRLLPLMANTRTVYWATRPDPAFEMEAVRQRQASLYRRRRDWIPIPSFLVPLLESADYHRADALILIGNDTVRSTFRTSSERVFCIDNPALTFPGVADPQRDWSQARTNFLFLSSWMLVQKGLDLVLEAFARRPDLHVWLCGPVDSEPDFVKAYRQELFHTPNIHTLGWVTMQSDAFAEITNRCGFQVFPSCAEGMSGSVINGMARGLVPICTATTGVDLDDFGLLLTDPSPETLGTVIDTAARMPVADLQRRAEAARAAATGRYTIANFRIQIDAALRESVQPR